MEETLSIANVGVDNKTENVVSEVKVVDSSNDYSKNYDALSEEMVLLKAELKDALSELRSLKSISEEFSALKSSMESRDVSYEPISGSAESNVEQVHFATIHDYFNYHFKR